MDGATETPKDSYVVPEVKAERAFEIMRVDMSNKMKESLIILE